MFSLTCVIVRETLKKEKTLTDTESILVVARGEGRGRGQRRQCQWEEGALGEGDQNVQTSICNKLGRTHMIE